MQLTIAQTDSSEYKVFYYPNGKIASEGYIKNNKPNGFWISYYITGIKKSEGKWKNNLLDSVWIFYDQMGDTTEKINYYLGKKSGYQYKYYTAENHKNKIKQRELYLNGKRSGKSLVYNVHGNIIKEVPYENDKKQGIGYEYDQNEKLITIIRYKNNEILFREEINRYNKRGEKEGLWKEFYDNGNVKEEKNYSDGKLDGYFKIYNKEGKLIETLFYNQGEIDLENENYEMDIELREDYDKDDNLIFQGSYKNNIPIGVHRYFDKKGNVVNSKTYNVYGKVISEGIVLINGKEDGSWVFYYSNGERKAEGNYSNGKKNGKWTYYYKNGKIKQQGNYSYGKLTGSWKWYYENGILLVEEFYIYGNRDGESVEYSETGEIISKGNYIEGLKEGEWIYKVGDQEYIGRYVMGERDGYWKSYYTNEQTLSFKGRYLQGNADGKHEYFYVNGKLKEEAYYENGMHVKSWSKYNEQGELVLVIQYKNGQVYKLNGVKVNWNENESHNL